MGLLLADCIPQLCLQLHNYSQAALTHAFAPWDSMHPTEVATPSSATSDPRVELTNVSSHWVLHYLMRFPSLLWTELSPHKTHMRGHSEKADFCKPGREPSSQPNHAGNLISDFQPPELRDNEYLSFKPPWPWYCVTAALAVLDTNLYSYNSPFIKLFSNYPTQASLFLLRYLFMQNMYFEFSFVCTYNFSTTYNFLYKWQLNYDLEN